jgi:hypothetical protein
MKHFLECSLACMCVVLACSYYAEAADSAWPTLVTYRFESDSVGSPPAGFVFSKGQSGKPGSWMIRAVADAQSGKNVLVQTDSDRSQDRFLIALPKQAPVKDVRITAKCKPMQGEVDQACGLVFRHVRAGRGTQVATWDGRVFSGAWHELAIEAVGEHIRVFFNRQEVIARSDALLRR